MSGITCFHVKRTINDIKKDPPLGVFNEKFKGIKVFGFPIIPPIVFNRLDDAHYAFREKYWIPSLYLPVMRGIIFINANEGILLFRAKLNYIPFIFCLLFSLVIFFNNFQQHESWFFFMIFYLISALFQYIRYYYISILGAYIFQNNQKGFA